MVCSRPLPQISWHPITGRTSKDLGLGRPMSFRLQFNSLNTTATPPWVRPLLPGGLFLATKPRPVPHSKSWTSSWNVFPSFIQVSVLIPKLVLIMTHFFFSFSGPLSMSSSVLKNLALSIVPLPCQTYSSFSLGGDRKEPAIISLILSDCTSSLLLAAPLGIASTAWSGCRICR